MITFSTNDNWRLDRIADVDVFNEVGFEVGHSGVVSLVIFSRGVETEVVYVDGLEPVRQECLDDF